MQEEREVMDNISQEEADIVIVGAGISGLTTSLGLHRLGLRSVVMESSDCLRITGFALTLWTNAWKALDAVGIAHSLRQHYPRITSVQVADSVSGLSSEISADSKKDNSNSNSRREVRCVRRNELLESLERELPRGTIRFSSKVVSFEDSGYHKLLHPADGSTIKTKVLIGCDGVNSVVAKWMGLEKAIYSGRSAIRGFVEYPDGHSFQPKFHVFFGGGVRYGFLPCDDKCLYWFCTFNSSLQTQCGKTRTTLSLGDA